MSTSTLEWARRGNLLSKAADYAELTKPKIASLVLAVVAVAAYGCSAGQPDWLVLLSALWGTFLFGASASVLNQRLEWRRDSLMERTATRPLPSGRLTLTEATVFGMALFFAGLVWLLLAVNVAAAFWAVLTWSIYVWVYTPLKSRTVWNTAVGAIAGALPVFIGLAAGTTSGSFLPDACAWQLFLIVLFWQFPHFMAIAWLYRRQYQAAGFKMLPVVDPSGRLSGLQAVVGAALLLLIVFLPGPLAGRGGWVFWAAALLGAGQFCVALAFWSRASSQTARRLLRASLVYLPGVLILLGLCF